jgi:hypothetical protein
METPDLFLRALNAWSTYRIAADGTHAAVNY